MYAITKSNNLAIHYIVPTPLPKKYTNKHLINSNLLNLIKQDRTTNPVKHPNTTKHSLKKAHTPDHTPYKHNNNKTTKKLQTNTQYKNNQKYQTHQTTHQTQLIRTQPTDLTQKIIKELKNYKNTKNYLNNPTYKHTNKNQQKKHTI
jgi:hypothetical protein